MNFMLFLALKPLNVDNKVKLCDISLKFGQVLQEIHRDYIGITLPCVHRITRVVAPSVLILNH